MKPTNIMNNNRVLLLFIFIFMCGSLAASASEQQALSIQDIMDFQSVSKSHLARDGNTVAFEIERDRGEKYALVLSGSGERLDSISRAHNIQLAEEMRVLIAEIEPSPTVLEYGDKNEKKVRGLAIHTPDGQTRIIDSVWKSELARSGEWVAMIHQSDEYFEKGKGKDNRIQARGYPCTVLNTLTNEERTFQNVYDLSFDSASSYLALACAWPSGDDAVQTLLVHDLADDDTEEVLEIDNGNIANLQWRPESHILSCTYSERDQDEGLFAGMVLVYDALEDEILAEIEPFGKESESASGWYIPNEHNKLSWTHNGRYLWFGVRPANDLETEYWPETPEGNDTLASVPHVQAKRTLQLWHWNDSLIAPNRKSNASRDKKQMYMCVFDTESWEAYALGAIDMPNVSKDIAHDITLTSTITPYERAITWDGWRYDYHAVHVPTGKSTRILDSVRTRQVYLSPSGTEIAYWKDSTWHRVALHLDSTGTIQCVDTLTLELSVNLSDEQFDYPREVPAIGSAGWNADGIGFSVYTKFDVLEWRPDTIISLTHDWGSRNNSSIRFRKPGLYYNPANEHVATSYNYDSRVRNVLTMSSAKSPKLLIPDTGEKTTIVTTQQNDSLIMFVKQRYDKYPDRMLLDRRSNTTHRLTTLNSQLENQNWGTGQLFTYVVDGDTVQGGILLPADYTPGHPLPVLTYFYRHYAHVALDFRTPAIKDNMCFPWYTSRGYAIFLPDITFEIGAPGASSVKNIEAGIRALADMGIADTTRLGIHGHSWSGYQVAFIVTKSDLFSAAIAGAPVSNMTSAYGGIRWGSGRSRQFQYERYQSRLGVSLWEDRTPYIENSPLFFADDINTPLLIMFGDKDSAVPWYQGIEMYMAMRRLGKPAWLLQYEGERHHLSSYPNKLDYFLKMDEFFSHFVLGAPAAPWLQ